VRERKRELFNRRQTAMKYNITTADTQDSATYTSTGAQAKYNNRVQHGQINCQIQAALSGSKQPHQAFTP